MKVAGDPYKREVVSILDLIIAQGETISTKSGVLLLDDIGDFLYTEFYNGLLLKKQTVFEFDFQGIKTANAYAMDRTVLMSQLLIKPLQSVIIITNANERVQNELIAAIYKRENEEGLRIPVLIKQKLDRDDKTDRQREEFFFLGPLEPQLRQVWDFIREHKKVTARDITEQIGIPIRNTSTILKRLFDFQITLRYPDTDQFGRYHYYYLP